MARQNEDIFLAGILSLKEYKGWMDAQMHGWVGCGIYERMDDGWIDGLFFVNTGQMDGWIFLYIADGLMAGWIGFCI